MNVSVSALNDAGQATGTVGVGVGVLYYDGQTAKDIGTLGGQLGYG